MKKFILIILSVLFSAFVVYTIGKKFFPFNGIFGARIIPADLLLSGNAMNNGKNVSFLCNFEIETGKKIPPGIYNGLGHSGHFSAKAFGKNSYSLAMEQTAGQIGVQNMKAIAMSAWVFVFPGAREPDGIFVLSVTGSFGASKYWRGIYVYGNSVPRGKWFRISSLFDLSGVIMKPGYEIHIYFWNRSRTDILVDDYYITFGGPEERRGESAWVDFTKDTVFRPRFNFPPFQTFYAGKEEISNRNSANLVPDNSDKEGFILPDDRIIAGDFLQTTGGTDEILVIPSSGPPGLFGFCPDSRSFKRINTIMNPEQFSSFHSLKVLKGRFSENSFDQLLLEDEHEFIVGNFAPLKNICSGTGAASSDFRVIWRSDPAFEETRLIPGDGRIFTGDLEGDRYTELLAITNDGSWKVLKFLTGKDNKTGWSTIASGNGTNSPFRNSDKGSVQTIIGRFLPGYSRDLVLTLSGDKTGRKFKSSLLRFDLVKSAFLPLDQNRVDSDLKIIGLDTLKPSDIFLYGDFRGNKTVEVLRYNRDWRYDLKELKFNDTTFNILGNIDFQGYEKDHNPKYYGVLKIFAGWFVDPTRTSLLLIGRNCKNRDMATDSCKDYMNLPELPDFISVYSLK